MTSRGMPSVERAVHLDAEPESIALAPATTALVVVDMQNAYLSEGGYLDRVGLMSAPAAP